SDDTTRMYGAVTATGGVNSGNGGFVETSGKNFRSVTGASVNTSAPEGLFGTWLLDPHNITVATGGGATLPLTFTTSASSDSIIDPSTITSLSFVQLQANNDITFANNVNM